MAKIIDLGRAEDDKLILSRTHLDRVMIIDKSVGAIQVGQVMAMNPTTGKLVKYNKASADAKEIFTIYTGEKFEAEQPNDFEATVLATGSIVNKEYVIGLDAGDFLGKHKLYLAGIILEEVFG